MINLIIRITNGYLSYKTFVFEQCYSTIQYANLLEKKFLFI